MTQPEAVAPDQWGELERLANRATPGPWRRDENNVWGACNPDDTTSYGMGINIVECRSSVPQWAREPLDYEKSETNAAFIAAANPATVLELIAAARSVGTSACASEPQNNPHPGRGEGEAYAWASEWHGIGSDAHALHDTEEAAEDNARWMNGYAFPLFAAPATYGKGEREAVARIIDAWPFQFEAAGCYDYHAKLRCAEARAKADAILQALQLGRE